MAAEKSKKEVCPDFLVTFFVGQSEATALFSEVVRRKDDPLYCATLGLPPSFVPPFFQEDGTFTVRLDQFELYTATMADEPDKPLSEHPVCGGDYITFHDTEEKTSIKALFVSISEIRLGYKKYAVHHGQIVFVGRTPINDIAVSFSDYISREKHFAIRIDEDGDAFVEDLKRGAVGIYVNGRRTNSKQLKLFDEIYAMGISIVYGGDFIAVRNLCLQSTLRPANGLSLKAVVSNAAPKDYFASTPRVVKSLDSDEVEIDAPPNPITPDKTPLALVIGPSFTMAVVMLASVGISVSNAIQGGNLGSLIASSMMAVGMLLGSLMWPMLLRNYQKQNAAIEEANRQTRYQEYINRIDKQLSTKYDRAVHLLNDSITPSPEALCSLLDTESKKLHLWERSILDDDFLSVRLGLGSRPFDVKIKVPRTGFQLNDDNLRALPGELAEKYHLLTDVPLTLDLCDYSTVGVIGDHVNVQKIVDEIVLNLIALHSFDEVKLVIVTSPAYLREFLSFKNLPHIWSNDKQVRYFATTTEEVHFVFNAIDDIVKDREETSSRDRDTIPKPYFVFVINEPSLVEHESLLRYLYSPQNTVGITAIFSYESITELPRACKVIIQSDETKAGYYVRNENENRFIEFKRDDLNMQSISDFSQKLTALPIKRDLKTLGIVDRISFLQLYKAGNIDALKIEDHWDNNNSAKSLAAPIGVMAGGEVFSLDLHQNYHGCHGIVAGTTGSGKSEFLQAFILSLAVNYSPREIAFVLIDFKGGDMARPFMAKTNSPALPHLAATISNLSGNILYRALVSLQAEIDSRQRRMNEAAKQLGVDKLDINSYHKYYKSGKLSVPLPHLIIIIDEFAQLKTQQPAFLTQLINVAQVGRSLGIHLILATQKPSGTVSPEIMSNSRFKVCLKVAEKQDSVDMLGKADAASIKNPGRLYLQVGYNEIYECIQAGYSGSDYLPMQTYVPESEITVQMTDNASNPIHSAKLELSATKTDKTQLEAVVAEMVSLGQKKGWFAKPLWLEMLPERVFLKDLATAPSRTLCEATIGLVDDVRAQAQYPLHIDFSKVGHLGIYGASGMGKTTFLQTVVYSMICQYHYTPEEVNFYAMDFGGRNLGYLESLPHTGGVVFGDDEVGIGNLEKLLNDIINERKSLFAAKHCGSYIDYRAISKTPLPAIVVLIDNYAVFREKYMEISDEFVSIIAAGKTYGLYFIITGSTKNAIHYKVTDYISSFYVLKMNDPNNYMDIFGRKPPIYPEDISGRGVTAINKEILMFQTAIAFDSETEAERNDAIIRQFADIAANWSGPCAVKLLQEDDESVDSSTAGPSEVPNVPRKRASTLEVSMPKLPDVLEDAPENLILGVSKSGASQYGITLSGADHVCLCAKSIEDLAARHRNLLQSISSQENRSIVFFDSGNGAFHEITADIPGCKYVDDTQKIDAYIEELKPILNAKLENPSGGTEPLFIVVGEINQFFEMITDEQAAFFRKVLKYIDSPRYGIYFICGFDASGSKNNDRLFVSLVVNAKNYVFCPGSIPLVASKIETLSNLPEPTPAGCYVYIDGKLGEVRR